MVAKYNKVKVDVRETMDDIRQQVADIEVEIHHTLEVMRHTKNNNVWKSLSDRHYDLKKQRRQLQHEMGRIYASRMRVMS